MKGLKMATKKEEPKYIGRYGEVLKDVQEYTVDDELFNPNPEFLLLGGQGIDEKGLERTVMFHVSRKTGKKCGGYTIYRHVNEGIVPIEECYYLNDLLDIIKKDITCFGIVCKAEDVQNDRQN